MRIFTTNSDIRYSPPQENNKTPSIHSKTNNTTTSPNIPSLPFPSTSSSPPISSTKVTNRNDNRNLSICDVALAIVTSPSSQFAVRVKHVHDSWLQRLCAQEKNYIFVSTAAVKGEPTAVVPCKDSWYDLCCKTGKAIENLYARMPNKLWYMRTDDDTLLVPDNLVTELRYIDPDEPVIVGSPYFIVVRDDNVVNWGRALIPHGALPDEEWSITDNLMYPGGGAGYVWSRGLMQRFIRNIALFYSICYRIVYEDVSIGLFTKKLGGRVLGNIGFRPWPPNVIEVVPREEFFKTLPITFHLWHDTWMMPIYDHLIHQFLLPRSNNSTSQSFEQVVRRLNSNEELEYLWLRTTRQKP